MSDSLRSHESQHATPSCPSPSPGVHSNSCPSSLWWDFFGRNDAKAETPVLWPPHVKSWHWKRLWCWEGLGTGGGGDDSGWDGWMALKTWWTWVWVNSRSWWWTGKPGMLRFMGSQRVGHDWATELNWTDVLILLVRALPECARRTPPIFHGCVLYV